MGEGSEDKALLVLNLYEFLALFALISAVLGVLVCYCLKSLRSILCCRRGTVSDKNVSTRSTSKSVKGSRRIPANIPAGRAQKEGGVQALGGLTSTRAEKASCWRRITDRGSTVALKHIPRGYTEQSDELTWEDDG